MEFPFGIHEARGIAAINDQGQTFYKDSGLDAAMGYAQESGIPYGVGLVKNRYVGRTFITPDQHSREQAVFSAGYLWLSAFLSLGGQLGILRFPCLCRNGGLPFITPFR